MRMEDEKGGGLSLLSLSDFSPLFLISMRKEFILCSL